MPDMKGIGYKTSLVNRIEGFDELRGISILMVLVAHWGLVYTPLMEFKLGPIGVDVFFVISGFLIGLILYKSKNQIGYYRNFYVRRIFRILPLATLLILLGVTLQILARGNIGSLWYYVIFIQNYIPAFWASNLGGEVDVLPLPATSPMWSLAVEEHVYLFLPLIVGITSRKALPYIVSLIAVAGIIVSIWTAHEYGMSWYTNLRETWNRMHYIALGVLLCRREWWKFVLAVLLIWFILVIVVHGAIGLVQYAIAICICSLVYSIREGRAPIRNRYLACLGKICFGVYLLHYPVAVVFKELAARGHLVSAGSQTVGFIIYFVASIGLAAVSFKYFEMPIQRQRGRFEKQG